jgi:L-glutamine---4-(methylsulfanyl)-2-oxobutanoate aminotransferase
VHDFLTVGAAAPLQAAGVTALEFPDAYYAELARNYETKRNLLLGILEQAGFRCYVPKGAYYIMCDISAHGFSNGVEFCRHLVEDIGVGAVPGSSFFSDPADGAHLIRFCFAKKSETLEAAGERLRKLSG